MSPFTLGGAQSLQYRYSEPDLPIIGSLIKQRAGFANAQGQNCATAALKYVFDKLGTDQSYDKLGQIVNNGDTTLAQMQQFIKEAGLESVAIIANSKTLKNLDLDKYQVILHLPEKNHFVVLHDMGDASMRVVDLSSNKFFYRKNLDCCGSITKALLIAKQPIQEAFAKIDNTENIVGSGCGESCTKRLQNDAEWPCTPRADKCYLFGHLIQYKRDGCEEAPSGSCSESSMVKTKSSSCEDDFGDCESDGEWTSWYIQACD